MEQPSLEAIRYLFIDDGFFWNPQSVLSLQDLQHPQDDALYLHNQEGNPTPDAAIPFSTYDGMALKNIFHDTLGIDVYLLSSQNNFSQIIESRMRVLGMAGYCPNLGDRLDFLKKFCQTHDCDYTNILYFGDDEAVLKQATKGLQVVTHSPAPFSFQGSHILRQFANQYCMDLPAITQLLAILRQGEEFSLSTSDTTPTLILDIDGTCTDACMIFATDGSRWKRFSRRDIDSITQWNRTGKRVFFVTGENGLIPYRLAEITETPENHVFTDAGNRKKSIVTSLCQQYGIHPQSITYIGDDINDFGVMEFLSHHRGRISCPNTAMPIIKNLPNVHVLRSSGGNGAIAELIGA